jgi:hypothetical protein
MSKKSANILITSLIFITVGGYFVYRSMHVILAIAGSGAVGIALLVGIPLVIYGVYKLVSFLNK